jgi:hypothetical protein
MAKKCTPCVIYEMGRPGGVWGGSVISKRRKVEGFGAQE